MGEPVLKRGRKKAQPVIKYKVETCWPLAPGIWRTVVDWDGGREALRSITALRSMQYPARLTVQFYDGVSYMPFQDPVMLGEFVLFELDKAGRMLSTQYPPDLCRYLPDWVYRCARREGTASDA